MIDMEQFSRSMEFNRTGMQLLLTDFITHYHCPMTRLQSLCEKEDYLGLMRYAGKLKKTLALFSDQDTPVKLAQLEHLAKHEFYPPEELMKNIQLDLEVVEQQIKQLTQ
ncbi:hypothetical protein ACPV5R_17450 [Vibrio astriarenae]